MKKAGAFTYVYNRIVPTIAMVGVASSYCPPPRGGCENRIED